MVFVAESNRLQLEVKDNKIWRLNKPRLDTQAYGGDKSRHEPADDTET